MTLFTPYKIRVTTIYLYLVLFGAVLFTPYKIRVTTIVIGNNIGFVVYSIQNKSYNNSLITPVSLYISCLLHTK